MDGLARERTRSARSQRNHIVDITCYVAGIGWCAGRHVAHNVRVVETQRTGIVSEREHCGKDSRAEYREFVCWNYVYFHRVFGLLQYQKATRVPTGEPLLNKCSNSLFTNELTW